MPATYAQGRKAIVDPAHDGLKPEPVTLMPPLVTATVPVWSTPLTVYSYWYLPVEDPRKALLSVIVVLVALEIVLLKVLTIFKFETRTLCKGEAWVPCA
jgi:hypothetical protein